MRIIHFCTRWLDNIFSLFIFLTILVLTGFTGYWIYALMRDAFHPDFVSILHNIAVTVVLLKAYRVLVFYFQKHHISIKYIMEISIIAPAVEIIFASSQQPMSVNILFGVFSLANLVLYLVFYERLTMIDKRERDPEIADSQRP